MSEEQGEYKTGSQKNLEYCRQFFYLDFTGQLFIRSDFIHELRDLKGRRLKELLDIICTTYYDREYIKKVDTFTKGRLLQSLLRREFNNKRFLLWDQLVERDGEICRKCGKIDNLSIDHIKPLSRDGTNDLENLQILCKQCNSKKGVR